MGTDAKTEKDNRLPEWSSADSLTAKIPMAATLQPDQRPTLLWNLQLAKVALTVHLNATLSIDAVGQAACDPRLVQLEAFERRLEAAIYRSRREGQAPDVVGHEPVSPDDIPDDVESIESLTPEIGQFLTELNLPQLTAVQPSSERQSPDADATRSLQEYEDLFRVIELPDVAKEFQTDACFSKFRIAGPNPMTIRGVSVKELIELVGNRISDEDLNVILGTKGDTLLGAGKSGRLCVANFETLSGIDPVVVVGSRMVVDPIAVFVEPKSDDAHILPVAIQLGQDPEESEIVLANTDDLYRWHIAKFIVQVADATYHELIVHLAHTHLVAESFSIATQRQLSAEHPIGRLLGPHFEGTNSINQGAATNLIAPNGPIDGIFANDRQPRLRSLQALAVSARLAFDFESNMPDVELRSRNVLNLKFFPYRDDVLLIWEAILHWAEAYIDLYYDDDVAVVGDAQLMAWADDIIQNGDVQRFEIPKTKGHLKRTLSMIMFLASAQHAAVNFPQAPMMTFAPAMAGTAWSDIPPMSQTSTKEDWLKMMPPIEKAHEQLNTLYVLGAIRYRRLGEYHSNVFPYWGKLESKAKDALDAFNQELQAIDKIIRVRNLHRGKFDYEFLMPSKIPASINT